MYKVPFIWEEVGLDLCYYMLSLLHNPLNQDYFLVQMVIPKLTSGRLTVLVLISHVHKLTCCDHVNKDYHKFKHDQKQYY